MTFLPAFIEIDGQASWKDSGGLRRHQRRARPEGGKQHLQILFVYVRGRETIQRAPICGLALQALAWAVAGPGVVLGCELATQPGPSMWGRGPDFLPSPSKDCFNRKLGA